MSTSEAVGSTAKGPLARRRDALDAALAILAAKQAFRPEEAAAILSRSMSWIGQEAAAGRIRLDRVGGSRRISWRIARSEILRVLSGQPKEDAA
jgi:hypothetical protein